MKFHNAKTKSAKRPKPPAVLPETWKSLYEKGLAFYALAPWVQVQADQIFGITDPVTGEIAYGSILGSQGDFFGLTLYRGREALELHLKLVKKEIPEGSPEIPDLYNALVVDFSPRLISEDDEDCKVRTSLPDPLCRETPSVTFRSYLPGYQGWYLNEEEASFLCIALESAMEHVEKNKDAKRSLSSYLLYTKKIGEDDSWHVEEKAIEPLAVKDLLPIPINAKKMKNLKGLKLHRDAPWELSISYTSGSIQDKDRPYLAKVYLIVHTETLMILQIKPIAIEECPRKALCDALLSTIELHKNIPAEIVFNKKEYYDAAKPLSKALGIDITLAENLPATEPALESLMRYMNKESS